VNSVLPADRRRPVYARRKIALDAKWVKMCEEFPFSSFPFSFSIFLVDSSSINERIREWKMRNGKWYMENEDVYL
jgi:hypothetical protein